MGGASYVYNGLGQRLQQTVGALVTQYVVDTQPGLWQIVQSVQGANTTCYVHGPMGLLEQQNPDTTWRWPVLDGLGSVRGVVDSTISPQESRLYSPYGEGYGNTGTSQTVYGFTGEVMDGNGLVQLRARYYSPTLGVFPSLDPIEGSMGQPSALNRYGYVGGQVINRVDSSGLIFETPHQWDSCTFSMPSVYGVNQFQSQALDCSSCYSGSDVFLCRIGSLPACQTHDSTPDCSCYIGFHELNCRAGKLPTCQKQPFPDCPSLKPDVLASWNASLGEISRHKTSDNSRIPSGYQLPTGQQVVDAVSTYKICLRPGNTGPGAAAYNLQTNSVVIPYFQTTIDPATILHELTHAYLANTCPSLFGLNTPSLLNEMIAFRSEGEIRYDFPNLANVNPFSKADLQDVHDHLELYFPNAPVEGRNAYASLPLYPSNYDADHAACGLPDLK